MAKKYTPPKSNKPVFDIAALEKEKNILYVSGANPERLKQVIKIINNFNYGIDR